MTPREDHTSATPDAAAAREDWLHRDEWRDNEPSRVELLRDEYGPGLL